MVIRIAICDDDLCICSQLEAMLIRILQQLDVKYEIEVFESGESLRMELEKQHFDILFLDIILPKMSGIDVGRYIRDELKDEMIQIAYISAKPDYAMQLFEFRPINFLLKPLEKEMVEKVIMKYMIITEQTHHVFEYKKRTEQYKVPLTDILYLESRGRKVNIFMVNEVDEFYESIENAHARLEKYNFLLIHKSILVNYHFIKKMSYEEVTMIDGTRLPISQSKRKEVRDMYAKIRERER